MKALLIHNSYIERGGEDELVEAQKALLEKNGHTVVYYERSNKEINDFSFKEKFGFLFKRIYWSKEIYDDVRLLIQDQKPDIAHIHNTFYVMSPSVYQACYDEGIPTVASIHNYRLLLNRANARREFPEFNVSLNDIKRYALRYLCVPRIIKRMGGDYLTERVDLLAAPSQFCIDIYSEEGFVKDQFRRLPPFIDIEKKSRDNVGQYALFVGRLVDYKGVHTLLDAFSQLPHFHLKIIGDGPLKGEVEKKVKDLKNIDYLGKMPYTQTIDQMRKAAFIVFPSKCYETFGRVIVDAYACGVPVVASNVGASTELVQENETGLLFKKGDVSDLASKIESLANNPNGVEYMGKKARQFYEDHFCAEKSYNQLMTIFNEALESKSNEKIHQPV